eukprot:353529-Chlamydomonas_euryale.AAC.6
MDRPYGWMERQTDGWNDRRMDGRTDGEMKLRHPRQSRRRVSVGLPRLHTCHSTQATAHLDTHPPGRPIRTHTAPCDAPCPPSRLQQSPPRARCRPTLRRRRASPPRRRSTRSPRRGAAPQTQCCAPTAASPAQSPPHRMSLQATRPLAAAPRRRAAPHWTRVATVTSGNAPGAQMGSAAPNQTASCPATPPSAPPAAAAAPSKGAWWRPSRLPHVRNRAAAAAPPGARHAPPRRRARTPRPLRLRRLAVSAAPPPPPAASAVVRTAVCASAPLAALPCAPRAPPPTPRFPRSNRPWRAPPLRAQACAHLRQPPQALRPAGRPAGEQLAPRPAFACACASGCDPLTTQWILLRWILARCRRPRQRHRRCSLRRPRSVCVVWRPRRCRPRPQRCRRCRHGGRPPRSGTSRPR